MHPNLIKKRLLPALICDRRIVGASCVPDVSSFRSESRSPKGQDPSLP